VALDTAAKRRASLGGIGLGILKAMPLPASGVSTDDRKLTAFSYITFDALTPLPSSRNRRGSVIHHSLPLRVLPLVDSTVDKGDRIHLALSYRLVDNAFLALGQVGGVATATGLVRSPHLFSMQADGVATAAVSPLSSPALLSLGQVDGVATVAAELVAGALFQITAAGSATAAATVIAPALLLISADGVASLTAILSSPAQLTLSQVDGVATATAEVTIFFRKRVKINGATVTVLRGHSGTVTVTKNKAGVVVRSVKIGGGVVS